MGRVKVYSKRFSKRWDRGDEKAPTDESTGIRAEQITGNAGWPVQFCFAAHAFWSRVPGLWTLLAEKMKTHGIKDAAGKEFAFEVDNFHLSRKGLCRLVAGIPGCIVTRKPSRFRWSHEDEDEFCTFELEGVRFVAWEPWGDNRRYWVGPKVEQGSSPKWCPQLDRVREAFNRARPFLGLLFGQSDGAANGSQPILSETNRTSSAAGSRR